MHRRSHRISLPSLQRSLASIGVLAVLLSARPAGGSGPGQVGCGVVAARPIPGDMLCIQKPGAICVRPDSAGMEGYGADACGFRVVGFLLVECGYPIRVGACE